MTAAEQTLDGRADGRHRLQKAAGGVVAVCAALGAIVGSTSPPPVRAVSTGPTELAAATVAGRTAPPTSATPTTDKPVSRRPPAPATIAPSGAQAAPAVASAPAVRMCSGRPVTAATAPLAGTGAWVDVYDWTLTYTNWNPTFVPSTVDKVAAAGVQTIYIETSTPTSTGDVLEPTRLAPIIARAHQLGLRVVTWYLPAFTDPTADLRRMVAAGSVGADGLGVDIESQDQHDPVLRSFRLVTLSAALRAALPATPIYAVVMPPVVTDVINQSFWPNFPWHALAPYYDAWIPMDYWTERTKGTPYRDAYLYTSENITRLRLDLGNPSAVVHAAGGIGDQVAAADLPGFVKAVKDTGAIGGSLYDWRVSATADWPAIASLRC